MRQSGSWQSGALADAASGGGSLAHRGCSGRLGRSHRRSPRLLVRTGTSRHSSVRHLWLTMLQRRRLPPYRHSRLLVADLLARVGGQCAHWPSGCTTTVRQWPRRGARSSDDNSCCDGASASTGGATDGADYSRLYSLTGDGLDDRRTLDQSRHDTRRVALATTVLAAVAVDRPTHDGSLSNSYCAISRIDCRGACSPLAFPVGALRALGDFTSLVPILEQRIRLCHELNDGGAVRRALAFDLFEAQTVDSPDVLPLFAPLREHLGDEQLDSSRRLRASRQLMIAADHHFDPITAREAYDRFRDIRPLDTSAELSQLHASLIYHATFGDRSEAIGCIQRILDLAKTIEQSWIQLASATSCVVGSRIVAADHFPFEVLEHAFQVCIACGVDTTAIRMGGILTVSAFDDGRHVEARHWCQASREVAGRIPPEAWCPDYPSGEIDLALLDGRYDRAEEFLRRLSSITPARPGPRMRREVLVYKTRVGQFCGRGTTDEDLRELHHFHSLGRTFGRHDDNAEVLWVALMERGAAQQASAMLSEYLTTARRELRRCNFWLRTRTAEDPVWARLAPQPFQTTQV